MSREIHNVQRDTQCPERYTMSREIHNVQRDSFYKMMRDANDFSLPGLFADHFGIPKLFQGFLGERSPSELVSMQPVMSEQ